MHSSSITTVLATLIATAYACEPCEHPERDFVLTRNVRRMQPEAMKAVSQPRAPLDWGQLNFMHTSDTHGWLVCHNTLLALISQNTDKVYRKVT
jgi:2',3'-cyclic-nucleotide 2'-phosphodiesterase (5'-nucleotidase family)